MTETLTVEKRKYQKILKDNYFSDSKNKVVWLVYLNDKKILETILDWLFVLPANFVIKTDLDFKKQNDNIAYLKDIKKDLFIWFDFIVCDNNLDLLKDYFKNWIIPIIPENNYMHSLLKEFDPMKNEGNSYLYSENNSFSIYYAIIRFLENYKFPYDHRNLVKNILSL